MAQAKTIVIIAPVNPGDEDRDIHSVVSLCEPDDYGYVEDWIDGECNFTAEMNFADVVALVERALARGWKIRSIDPIGGEWWEPIVAT